ncbi:MAG: hypothetical protein L6311_01765 [Cellulomonas sp.]|nr:hypothetical protein [Cellulomonas sp.]
MSTSEVTQALEGFEASLRRLGVPVVDRLRPGLTAGQVEQISAEFGVRLSQDAAAWWMWHDGDRERYEDDWGTPGLTPGTVFSGLRSSLTRGTWFHLATWTAAFDDPDPLVDTLEWSWAFHPEYLILLDRDSPLVMDCSDPEALDSPTGLYSAGSGIGRTISLTERIGWWHWALDHGFWLLTDDGRWDLDLTKAPGQLVGLEARDNAY